MSKREEFNAALKTAMRSKDQVSLSTLRLITAAVKDRDIEARSKGKDDGITESEILSLLQSMVKQRQESSKTYKDAGREELAQREEQEIEVIERFLPKQMDSSEAGKTIESLISEMGVSDIRDMGKVMAELKSRYAGQIDMGKASGMVKEKLAG